MNTLARLDAAQEPERKRTDALSFGPLDRPGFIEKTGIVVQPLSKVQPKSSLCEPSRASLSVSESDVR